MHTLKDDLQDVVREKKISLVRAVSLEEDRRAHHESAGEADRAETSLPPLHRARRTRGILFGAILLLLLGLAALGSVFYIMRERSGQQPAPTFASLLFSEQSVYFPLDNQTSSDLKRMIGNARRSSQGTLGSVTRIIPVFSEEAAARGGARAATFSEFMAALGARAPEELFRALSSDFFFGIHTVDKNAPLIVVTVLSYDRAFAAMLAWEKTINADLAPAFTLVQPFRQDANGVLVERNFQDLVMRNYDVRALEDDSGQIQMYYSFPTQRVLIIAESPYSFSEVISRLQAGRKL